MSDLEVTLLRGAIGLLALGIAWLVRAVVSRGAEIAVLQERITHLPDAQAMASLGATIQRLSGELHGVRELLERQAQITERHERYLIEKGL